MLTYWDLVPRDIWWLVFGYVAPRIEHPTKWIKSSTRPTTSIRVEEDYRFLALQQSSATLLAWMETKSAHPVEDWILATFGSSLLPLALEDFLIQVFAFLHLYSMAERLCWLARLGFIPLATQYYRALQEFSDRGPHKHAYTGVFRMANPGYMNETRGRLFLDLYEATLRSGSLKVIAAIEALLGPSQVAIYQTCLYSWIEYSEEVLLWLIPHLTPYQKQLLMRQAIYRQLTEILDLIIPEIHWNMWSCFRFLMVGYDPFIRQLDRKYLVALFAQVEPQSLPFPPLMDMVKWAAVFPNHLLLENWFPALECSINCSQEELHRLITRLIRNPPIHSIGHLSNPIFIRDDSTTYSHRLRFLQMFYRRFFQIFDRPELLYSSYALLKRSDLLEQLLPFLEPLISKALAQGLIRPTRHFP